MTKLEQLNIFDLFKEAEGAGLEGLESNKVKKKQEKQPVGKNTARRAEIGAERGRGTKREGVRFSEGLFTDTQWSDAREKARFANHFVRFVESGFSWNLFHSWFYQRLSQTFGFIAHYNRKQFYEEYFQSNERQVEFVQQRSSGSMIGVGDPAWTYSDVEIILSQWLKSN